VNHFLMGLALLASLAAPKVITVQYAAPLAGQTVLVSIDGRRPKPEFAGKLGFRDKNSSWTSVCADVRSPVTASQFFPVRILSSAETGGRIAMAGNIVAKYFKSAKTPNQCAALQIAVWEALEDGGTEPDFMRGRFQVQADTDILGYSFKYYQAANEEGDATYLQTGDGGGQGQLSTTH